MSFVIAIIVPLIASLLTFFSGFGLGTLLLPAFSLLFPLDAAVAMTAIVHLLNNLFKLFLTGKHIDRRVALIFGIPAVAASFAGAYVLILISKRKPLLEYTFGGKMVAIFPIDLVIGMLMIFFALMELLPFKGFRLQKRWIPLGGLASGFFGGLSGHQGAFRSIFLLRAGLDKMAYIATGVVIACAVDLVRLFVYGTSIDIRQMQKGQFWLIALATISAWLGAWIGNKTLTVISIKMIHRLVGLLLISLGALIATGLI